MNKKRLLVGAGIGAVFVIAIIVYALCMYQSISYPVYRKECPKDDAVGSIGSCGLILDKIISLRNEENNKGFEVCFNTLPGPRSFERIYAISSASSGFSAGGMYFDKEGQFITSETVDDTGQLYSDGIYIGNILDENPPTSWGSTLDMCTSVPEWFFNTKVDRNTAK